MKRALLIATGTVGGLGAVLAITPPNLSGTTGLASKQSTTPVATDGSFTGDPISISFGIVQVMITVQNGKIIDAQAVKAPDGSNGAYTEYSIPLLREQTLTAQSANIQGVSAASHTSDGWHQSLVSAIAKAGL